MVNNLTISLFIEDLVAYLNNKFAMDSRISNAKKPVGALAFNRKMIEDATKPFFVIQSLSNSPKDETFLRVETITASIQIDVFALKGYFGGKVYLAEPMSIVLQDVISNYMEELKFGDANDNIRLMREITSSPAMPFDDGMRAYSASLRYEFTIMKDYQKIYN